MYIHSPLNLAHAHKQVVEGHPATSRRLKTALVVLNLLASVHFRRCFAYIVLALMTSLITSTQFLDVPPGRPPRPRAGQQPGGPAEAVKLPPEPEHDISGQLQVVDEGAGDRVNCGG